VSCSRKIPKLLARFFHQSRIARTSLSWHISVVVKDWFLLQETNGSLVLTRQELVSLQRVCFCSSCQSVFVDLCVLYGEFPRKSKDQIRDCYLARNSTHRIGVSGQKRSSYVWSCICAGVTCLCLIFQSLCVCVCVHSRHLCLCPYSPSVKIIAHTWNKPRSRLCLNRLLLALWTTNRVKVLFFSYSSISERALLCLKVPGLRPLVLRIRAG
jgi:hypothetical protein